MAYDQYGNYIPDQQSPVSQGLTNLGYTDPFGQQTSSWDAGYGGNQQKTGLGSGSFYIPNAQQQGQGSGMTQAGGYSPTATGMQNYLQGQGYMSNIPSSQMPSAGGQGSMYNLPSGTYNPQQAGYMMQGGLTQQQYGLNQSGIAQGIQNYSNQLSTLGIPTGMTGARQVADIAAGGASTEQKQQTQDMLSALQGQRGTGAGLGSNVDQLMATALGTQSATARSTYANALVAYLQQQAQMAASGPAALSPKA